VRRNDEVEAQRRRWTFYETIIIPNLGSGAEQEPESSFSKVL
jgi:hypothetical protein